MDKDIKLLLKIIGICFVVSVILIILIFIFLFSAQVYACSKTGGDWIFFKQISDDECMILGADGCKNNSKCVLSITNLSDFENPICKAKSGCKCPESSKTWYGDSRGCS